jgi:magnesium transporter
MQLVAYGPSEEVVEAEIASLEELPPYLKRYPVTWINVDGLGDAETLVELGTLLNIHRLALEDVVNVPQRPKYEEYPDGAFFVVRMPTPTAPLDTEQVSLYLTDRVLVTFQERHDPDCLDGVRNRIRGRGPRLMSSGPDYLAYAVIDSIVDAYFPLLEQYGDQLDECEAEILARPDDALLIRLHGLKSELTHARRIAFAVREAVATTVRTEVPLITDATQLYLRDCHDHAIQLLDLIETYRETASSLMDFYLSSVSHRMNEVMKVLTIIATLFIPLGFFVGLYGMNFDTSSPYNMPELGWRYGYLTAISVMLLVVVGMLFYFRRKGWIGPSKGPRHDGHQDPPTSPRS